jgi:hypothetical protein
LAVLRPQSHKLNKPIPDDLVPILAKDEEKQKQIREKASKDAASAQARSIGASSNLANAAANPNRLAAQATTKLSPDAVRKAGAPAPSKPLGTNASPAATTTTTAATKSPIGTAQPGKASGPTKPVISMVIQPIPPFKGGKSRPQPTTSVSNSENVSASNGASKLPASSSTPAVVPSTPASPTTGSNNRLNINASSFKPNPKASAFSPVALVCSFYLRLC